MTLWLNPCPRRVGAVMFFQPYIWLILICRFFDKCTLSLSITTSNFQAHQIENNSTEKHLQAGAQIRLNWDNSSSPGIVSHQLCPGYVGFLRINPYPWMIVVMFHPCPCKVLTFISYPHRFGDVQPLHMQGSYDLILTHAAFLCHLTLAHAGSIGFNHCPCRVVVMF